MKRISRFFSGTTAAVLSLSSLLSLGITGVAHAASIAWDGGGADNNFSTAANWAGDVVPVDGDSIVIDVSSGISDSEVLNNDLTNLQLTGITVTGTGADLQGPTLSGNPIGLEGVLSTSYGGAIFSLSTDITLTGDLTISGSSYLYILSDSAIDLAGHILSVNNYYTFVQGSISGAGAINFAPGMSASLEGANTTSASITISGGVLTVDPGSLGTGTITIDGADANLSFCGFKGASVSNNIVLNNANSAALSSVGSCGMGVPLTQSDPDANVTLAGSVTLQSDSRVAPSGIMTITGPLLGAHTISITDGQLGSLVINSSDNQSNTPNSTLSSSVKTTEVSDKLPSTDVTVSANEILIIKDTGERGDITLDGGLLKGTGTVGTIYLNLGVVAPGMSPGILNSGDFVATGGSYDVEIGGTTAGQYDQLNVTGAVNLGSATTLNVSLWNDFVPSLNNTFVIVNNDGSDAVVGAFQGLAEGATFEQDGIVFKISYVGGDGNDVTLTVQNVPTVPDTGFALVTANPILSIGLMTVAAGLIFAIARRTRLSQVTARSVNRRKK